MHNKALIKKLQLPLGPAVLDTTEQLGMPAHLVEAVAFAWLARRCLRREACNIRSVTGANGLRMLGAIYHAT